MCDMNQPIEKIQTEGSQSEISIPSINDNNVTIGYSQWLLGGEESYHPVGEMVTVKKLPGGKYDIKWSSERNQYYFQKMDLVLDELLELPSTTFSTIIDDIKYFWDNKELFERYKFAYKRGILLYGEAGCGKTSITAQLSNHIIKDGGIVISINNGRMLENYAQAIPGLLRKIQPDVPILGLIEDLDGLLKFSDNETLLLNILDGMNQMNNVVYVGCTNYPEQLKERILNRPSRFDKRYHIGLPNAHVRKYYLEHKIDKKDWEKYNIAELVDKSEGLTLAHLGELIKGVFIFNKDVDIVIEELKNMKLFISSTKFEGNNNKINGFNTKKS